MNMTDMQKVFSLCSTGWVNRCRESCMNWCNEFTRIGRLALFFAFRYDLICRQSLFFIIWDTFDDPFSTHFIVLRAHSTCYLDLSFWLKRIKWFEWCVSSLAWMSAAWKVYKLKVDDREKVLVHTGELPWDLPREGTGPLGWQETGLQSWSQQWRVPSEYSGGVVVNRWKGFKLLLPWTGQEGLFTSWRSPSYRCAVISWLDVHGFCLLPSLFSSIHTNFAEHAFNMVN